MIFLSILIFILAMSLPFFKTQITPIFFTRIAALAFIYAGVLTFNALHIQSIGSGIGIYSGFFQVTYFSLFIETFLYIVGALILLSWAIIKNELNNPLKKTFFDKEISPIFDSSLSSATLNRNVTLTSMGLESKEYSLIVLFSTLGGSFLLSAGDLLSMYLSIELQSFGLYILATIYRDSSSATGAGLKYFLLGGLSSCLILLGASLIYSFTGLTNLESIYNLISVISLNNLSLSEINLITILNDLPLLSPKVTEVGFEIYTPNTELSLIINNSNENASTTNIIPTLTANVIPGISLGLILIVVGFLFKIAGAPFHNWSPDVYDESPTNVTIWLTIMPKISIVIFLLELELGIVSQLTFPILNSFMSNSTEFENLSQDTLSQLIATIENFYENLILSDFYIYYLIDQVTKFKLIEQSVMGGCTYILKNIFLLTSFFSLILGTIVGLAQIRIKRLLAYSTISHVGFLLLALSINTEQSTEALILYLIQYIFTSLNTFFILLAFGYILNSSINSKLNGARTSSSDSSLWSLKEIKFNSDIKFILDLKGQFSSNPILSLSLAICLFSMAGIPPLIGFFGKQSVLYAAIGNGYYFMAFLAIVLSVISAYYYLRIIKELHSESNINLNSSNLSSIKIIETNKSNIKSSLILTNIHSFIIASLTLFILLFVLKPSIILNSTVLLSLSLFNG